MNTILAFTVAASRATLGRKALWMLKREMRVTRAAEIPEGQRLKVAFHRGPRVCGRGSGGGDASWVPRVVFW